MDHLLLGYNYVTFTNPKPSQLTKYWVMFWISKWHATHSPPYTTFQTKTSDNKRRFHFPEIILEEAREIYTYKYNVGVGMTTLKYVNTSAKM